MQNDKCRDWMKDWTRDILENWWKKDPKIPKTTLKNGSKLYLPSNHKQRSCLNLGDSTQLCCGVTGNRYERATEP